MKDTTLSALFPSFPKQMQGIQLNADRDHFPNASVRLDML